MINILNYGIELYGLPNNFHSKTFTLETTAYSIWEIYTASVIIKLKKTHGNEKRTQIKLLSLNICFRKNKFGA